MTLQNAINRFTGLSNIQQDSSGNVGIKTPTPQTDLDVQGNSWFHGSYMFLEYTDFQQSLGSQAVTVQRTTADDVGNSYFTLFNPVHNVNATFSYTYSFFRGSLTSGNTAVAICKADGAGTVNHLFSGNGNSYLAINNGLVGIGTNLPTQKLHVNGVIRATSLLIGTAQQFFGWASAIPTTGTYKRGDVLFNSSATASGFVGWICTVAGTPGTWKTFGVISA